MELQAKGWKVRSHLAHLELKEVSFLLHFFGNLGPGDLRADHAVLFGMLSLLLLDFCTVIRADGIVKALARARTHVFPSKTAASLFLNYQSEEAGTLQLGAAINS